MKHLVIGNLHGRPEWQTLSLKDYDKIIFMGNYADSMFETDQGIVDNLEQVISFKKQNPEKVVLLLGKHDTQYLHYPTHQYLGFRPSIQPALTALYNANQDLFQMAYQHHQHLFTSSGITNSWYGCIIRSAIFHDFADKEHRIAELTNKLAHTERGSLFYIDGIFCDYPLPNGPLLADYRETSTDMLRGYHQVVGGIPVLNMHTVSFKDHSVTYLGDFYLRSGNGLCELDI